jgi:hypothetical protein
VIMAAAHAVPATDISLATLKAVPQLPFLL